MHRCWDSYRSVDMGGRQANRPHGADEVAARRSRFRIAFLSMRDSGLVPANFQDVEHDLALLARRHRQIVPGDRLPIECPQSTESTPCGLTCGLWSFIRKRHLIGAVELRRTVCGCDASPLSLADANVPRGLAVAAGLAVKVWGARAGHNGHQRTAPASSFKVFSGLTTSFPPSCNDDR
jgi:hypothetical protein